MAYEMEVYEDMKIKSLEDHLIYMAFIIHKHILKGENRNYFMLWPGGPDMCVLFIDENKTITHGKRYSIKPNKEETILEHKVMPNAPLLLHTLKEKINVVELTLQYNDISKRIIIAEAPNSQLTDYQINPLLKY